MTTKTLWLIRHAKSRQDGTEDYDRYLSYRGFEQCIEMGRYIASTPNPPEYFLCSSAARTKLTADILNAHLGGVVESSSLLYTFNGSELLTGVRTLAHSKKIENISSLAIVAHNSAISQLLALTIRDPSTSSLPTLGIACIEFEGKWRDIGDVTGHLVDRRKPHVKADHRDDAW